MKAGAWVLTTGLLTLAGTAGAQDLGAYGRLAASLDEAARVRPTSAPAALAQLDRAQQALETLGPTLRNRQIVSGLTDALTAARAALARTPAELQAQVQLARGLMRKALYDQTLAALSTGAANGDAQLRLLTRDFALGGAAAQATLTDARAGSLERVAWRLQRAAVQKVDAALRGTRPEQTTGSYLNLARATGWFTVVQDAPGTTLKVAQFGEALRQLTGGDTAALASSLTTLRAGTQALATGLATPPAGRATGAATPGAGTPTNTPATAPVSGAAGQETPGPTGSTPATGTPTSGTPTTGTPAASTSGVDGAYAGLGRALSAASHADLPAARAGLGQAEQALAGAPSSLRGAAGYDRLLADLRAAQARTALRPADVQGLIGALGNLELAAAGQPLSGLNSMSANTARNMGGWVRVLVFLLLSLLSAAPLYLLNLAFGGRNLYWRAISGGLVLLLLPTLLEGVFGLLGALGDALNIGGLRSLLNVSLTQGAYGLPLWALLTAGAIGLIAFGFRGLCVQFGLLGRGASARNDTQDASLDWDDDL
ncbi:hypothetical protein [Deinococcus hohokamensis]|uniref:Uncharacterized protein n=1 Tax=Deinococcus hohokamensis TaxID=309883 RepID=A0ABV9IFP6_9DEIO